MCTRVDPQRGRTVLSGRFAAETLNNESRPRCAGMQGRRSFPSDHTRASLVRRELSSGQLFYPSHRRGAMTSTARQRSRDAARRALRVAVEQDFLDSFEAPVGTLQLARRLGVRLTSIQSSIRRGQLIAELVGGRWQIDVETNRDYILDHMPKRPQRPGAPEQAAERPPTWSSPSRSPRPPRSSSNGPVFPRWKPHN